MTMTTHKLYFNEGSSDKVYEISLIPEPNGSFSVLTKYGRRGSKLMEGVKNFGSQLEASREYNKVLGSKLKKGYKVDSVTKPTAVAQKTVHKEVPKPVVKANEKLLNQILERVKASTTKQLRLKLVPGLKAELENLQKSLIQEKVEVEFVILQGQEEVALIRAA